MIKYTSYKEEEERNEGFGDLFGVSKASSKPLFSHLVWRGAQFDSKPYLSGPRSTSIPHPPLAFLTFRLVSSPAAAVADQNRRWGRRGAFGGAREFQGEAREIPICVLASMVCRNPWIPRNLRHRPSRAEAEEEARTPWVEHSPALASTAVMLPFAPPPGAGL